MTTISKSFLLVVLLLSGGLLLSGCGSADEEVVPLIRPVRYEQVFLTGGSQARTFAGTARAGAETPLSFKVAGSVQQVAVKVGDRVEAGQLLAEIDASDYQLRVDQAQASLAQAESQERRAAADYERVLGLYENGTASRSDLDALRAASESAVAAVRAATSQLALAQQQVRYTRLTAPTEGSVAQVSVEVNENVRAGQPVVVVASGDQPEMEVAVPDRFIAQIQEGTAATVTFDALPGRSFSATVREVSVTATRATTYPVTVRLEAADEAIRPGMAGEVTFELGASSQAERLLVPVVAVSEDRQGRFVFVVEPSADEIGIARRRPVDVGALSADGLEVIAGLTDGEIVVTAGLNTLTDGQQVRLLAR